MKLKLNTPANTIKYAIQKDLEKVAEILSIPLEYMTVSVSKASQKSDYQCSGILPYAKEMNRQPLICAQDFAIAFARISVFDLVVSGPGFLTFSIPEEMLTDQINDIRCDSKSFLPSIVGRHKLIIDYGGPNIAKELHIGHLRSALIGQSLASIYRFLGVDVLADIHLGDWGLQMGLVIAQLRDEKGEQWFFGNTYDITSEDLALVYPKASKFSKSDVSFLERARTETALLQDMKSPQKEIWERIVSVSLEAIRRDYSRLGVDFDLWFGESRYQKLTTELCNQMLENGLATISDKAVVVHLGDSNMPPLILKNSRGAFGYSGTDMAAAVERITQLEADEIIYVVDARQTLHFNQIFSVLKKMGFGNTKVRHIAFGTINGPDGKPFKTRDGGVMKLWDLMDAMKKIALERMAALSKLDTQNCISEISEKIAMAAIKYGELSHDREGSYSFNPVKFSESEGDTGPYLLYTSVRISSLLKKCAEKDIQPGAIKYLGSGGRGIVLQIDKFPDVIAKVIQSNKPSILAIHLYSLANEINSYYHQNRIFESKGFSDDAISYLSILTVAQDQLNLGLNLLGIDIPEKM